MELDLDDEEIEYLCSNDDLKITLESVGPLCEKENINDNMISGSEGCC